MNEDETNGQKMKLPPNKKWLIIAALALIAVIVLIAGIVAVVSSGSQSTQNKKTGKEAGANSAISVGDFRYVNACQALPRVDTERHFAKLSDSVSTNNTYAEPLAANEDSADIDEITSDCSQGFAAGTPFANATVILKIEQYPDVTKAKSMFDTLNRTDQEKDDLEELNGSYGLDVKEPGASDIISEIDSSIWNSATNEAITLVDNKLVRFSMVLGDDAAKSAFRKSFVAALPGVIKNTKNDQLSQVASQPLQQNGSSVYGQKIGEATYLDPCKVLSGNGFKTLTGQSSDSFRTGVRYYANPITVPLGNSESGYTSNACTRYTASDADENGRVELDVDYYKTAGEAQTALKERVSGLVAKGERLGTFSDVAGIGDYASYKIFGPDAVGNKNSTTLYVQKGPYTVEITANAFGRERRAILVDSYKKAAAEILKQLPV